uniref:Uncharacterized protein n=1 Tax=Ciona savignyi TaxID=51511 RepID=H2Z8M6_CIOSA
MAKQMEKNSEIASVSFEDGSNLVSHFQLAPTSTPVFKTESLKDETDALGSGSLNTSQAHPKKKGGFVITSVKDNVDGDESADDLDESHASYSDISYSRTTDHDPESSASEDTLNLTVQDGPSGNGNGQAGAMTTVPTVTAKNLKTYQAHMQTKTRYEQYPDNESDANPPQIKDGSSKVVTLAGENLPQTKPSTIQFIENRTSEQVLNGVPFNSSGCKGATPAKTLASRVYKVVKRDTQQPVKRERSRWGYFDYPDSQSPNLGFVSQSTSDSRL